EMLPSSRHRGGLRFGSGVAFAVRVTVVFSLSGALVFLFVFFFAFAKRAQCDSQHREKLGHPALQNTEGSDAGLSWWERTEGALYSASQNLIENLNAQQ